MKILIFRDFLWCGKKSSDFKNIKNLINNRLKFLAAKYCKFLTNKLANSFVLCSFDWILVSYLKIMPFRKKTFPEKMGNVCFLLPHCNPQIFYVEKFVFVQFSKIVLLRGRIFRSLKSIFKRFLFAIITYFGNNNRQHP